MEKIPSREDIIQTILEEAEDTSYSVFDAVRRGGVSPEWVEATVRVKKKRQWRKLSKFSHVCPPGTGCNLCMYMINGACLLMAEETDLSCKDCRVLVNGICTNFMKRATVSY